MYLARSRHMLGPFKSFMFKLFNATLANSMWDWP